MHLVLSEKVGLGKGIGSRFPSEHGPIAGRDRVLAIRRFRSPRQTRSSVRLCPKLLTCPRRAGTRALSRYGPLTARAN
jgi:hypothetical protein